jgi:hypothetical protein
MPEPAEAPENHAVPAVPQPRAFGEGIIVERKLCISNENTDWFVKQCEIVDDKTFVCLNCKDPALHKFATGRTLLWGKRSQKHVDLGAQTKFMSKLIKARSDSANEKWFELQKEMGNKRKKIRKPRADDGLTCGRIIQVTMEYEGQTHTMSCLFGVKRKPVWVEATPTNLGFVAMGMKSDWDAGRMVPKRVKKNKSDEESEDDDDDDDDDDDEEH